MKVHAICNISCAPCRKEPSERSEMVNQVLFGEALKVLETKQSWSKVELEYDGYECWMDNKQFIAISAAEYNRISQGDYHLPTEPVEVLKQISPKLLFPILMGSNLPDYNKGSFVIGKNKYSVKGKVKRFNEKSTRNQIIETAFMYLNTPYLWGGRSLFGIDCSGYTQMVYKLNGIRIPRDASQQAEVFNPGNLSFLEEAQPGDLAFFDNDDGKIVHVGFVLENNQIIHASGKVRIDKLDHQGIFNRDLNKYTHKLRLLKNIIGNK